MRLCTLLLYTQASCWGASPQVMASLPFSVFVLVSPCEDSN